MTLHRPRRSTRRSSRCCPKTRSIGSITSSARKRSRKSWCCASPTASSSRCGPALMSTTFRSHPARPRPRGTGAAEAAATYKKNARALGPWGPTPFSPPPAMIQMEPPISFDADAVRAKKTELFQAIHPISPADAVRGQYGAGVVLGEKVHDYRHEPDVAPESSTETYVALKLGIDNWRWAGVPFYLRTGKYLSARYTEIAVQFRQAPYPLFRETPVERLPANILTLRIQPDEGLSLSFSAKRPGAEIEIDGVEMDFAYRDYFAPLASVGYETLIYDCLIGDATLFQRADTVDAA